ncbi:coiled-coil domain-containing protein 78 isoform X3 [Coturnix japonica]|uniref:coiled-coil domain-containing protein 78 isoform X3 n=1 Tax=Coturnix japonica TaxID=93934 RepID=UPI0013A5E937|nr:coiled-coil domain-containing protein 78 isoform X3 [Coturnix japonica]
MDFGSAADKENVTALTEQAQHLANKNVQLQDRNERLYAGFGDVQERMGRLTGSKPDLSPRMIFSEEEKLKISKELVDLQIETNKMKEQYETEKFELKNMILALENRVLELELCSEKVSGERDALRDHLHALETSRKELADEYIILKSNYLALGKELDQEVLKNEELSLELLSLTNARSTESNQQHSHASATESAAEPDRVMVHRPPAQKVKPEDVAAPEHEWQNPGRNLLGNQDHIKEEIEKLKQTYDSQQQKLEEKVIAMGKELQEAKKAARDPQQKLAEQSAEYVDSKPSTRTGPSKAPAEHADMKRLVDNMLKDIRASYKAREEQLAGAARGYKKRMKNMAKKHENLLIAYSVQREKIRSLGSSEMDSGPAELHFAITDPELQTNTTQELNRLRENKVKLELQLHELQKKRLKETSGFQLSPDQKRDEEGWAEVRKQLQEFTHSTQEDLEKERSQLLTRAIVAEEQVLELQDYIEKHLARYRQEVLWVRKLAGGEEPRARSAGAADAHSLPRSRKAISREL